MNRYVKIWIITSIVSLLIFSIYFPDYFLLDAAKIIATIGSIAIMRLSVRSASFENSGSSRAVNIFSGQISSWILLGILSLTQIAYVNEHVYGTDPASTSLYDGIFTHGGYMPYSDNAHFLVSVQSFLRYGITVSMAVFRPSGVLWSAFLYKLSGESMINYFYLQSFLSSIAIWSLANSLRYFFHWFWVLLFSLFLSRYVGLLQGTFMTELASMPFALMSFSMFMLGWQEKRRFFSFIGLSLLAITFEMRPAVFLLPPLLFLLLGWSSQRDLPFSWKNVFMGMVIYLATMICIRLSIWMLEFPPPSISNTYGKLYQIYKGSEAWNESNNINAGIYGQDPIKMHQYRQEYVHRLILQDPLPLIRNYFSGLIRAIQSPQKIFEVIDPMMSRTAAILLLFLLLSGFFIHQGKRPIILLHAAVVFYFIAAILSLPLLHAEFRVMSVTQPIVVILFVMAMNNLWIIFRHIYVIIAPLLGLGNINKSVNISLEFRDYTLSSDRLKPLLTISMMLILLILFAPIIIDKTRPESTHNLISKEYTSKVPTDTSHRYFLVDVKNSPRMRFVKHEIPVSTSPAEMPLSRIKDRWPLDSTMRDGFHLLNALNHIDFPEKRYHATQLVIPDHLVSGYNLDKSDALLLEVVKINVSNGPYIFRYHLAKRIIPSRNVHSSK